MSGKWSKARVVKMLASRAANKKLHLNYKERGMKSERVSGNEQHTSNVPKQTVASPDIKEATILLRQVVLNIYKKQVDQLTMDDMNILRAYKALTERAQ
jgi:hypothetical protein